MGSFYLKPKSPNGSFTNFKHFTNFALNMNLI